MARASGRAHLEHEQAKAKLKGLMPEDAKEAIGHGVRAKRSKSDLLGRRRRQSHDRFGQCCCQCCNRRARPPTKKPSLLSKAIRELPTFGLWMFDSNIPNERGWGASLFRVAITHLEIDLLPGPFPRLYGDASD